MATITTSILSVAPSPVLCLPTYIMLVSIPLCINSVLPLLLVDPGEGEVIVAPDRMGLPSYQSSLILFQRPGILVISLPPPTLFLSPILFPHWFSFYLSVQRPICLCQSRLLFNIFNCSVPACFCFFCISAPPASTCHETARQLAALFVPGYSRANGLTGQVLVCDHPEPSIIPVDI